jgi:hypothetical protein
MRLYRCRLYSSDSVKGIWSEARIDDPGERRDSAQTVLRSVSNRPCQQRSHRTFTECVDKYTLSYQVKWIMPHSIIVREKTFTQLRVIWKFKSGGRGSMNE